MSDPRDVSPVPWMNPREYAETMRRALDGDPEALRSLFFGPADLDDRATGGTA